MTTVRDLLDTDVVKLTVQTEDSNPTYDDIIYGVSDPSGTALSKKIALKNLGKALGWVDVRGYASINDAVIAIGSNQTILFIPNAQTMIANLTIPSTLSLVIPKGGSIIKASTFILTVNGTIVAGNYQIFSGFTYGDDLLLNNSVTQNRAWYGSYVNFEVVGLNWEDGVIDANAQILSYSTAAVDVGGTLNLGGKYDPSYNYFLGFGRIAGRKENTVPGDYSGYLQFSTNRYIGGGFDERMRITSEGKVGIGIKVPIARLEISDLNIADGQSDANVHIYTSNTAAVNIGGSLNLGGEYDSGSNAALGFARIAGRKENATNGNWSGYLQFSTRRYGGGLDERMRITSEGNVGIGTVSPGYPLEVNGHVKVGDNLYIANSTGDQYNSFRIDGYQNALYIAAASLGGAATGTSIRFRTAPAATGEFDRMTIDSAGNVGIGTTAPIDILHLERDGYMYLVMQGKSSSSSYGTAIVMGRWISSQEDLIYFSTTTTTDWTVGIPYNSGSANSKFSIGRSGLIGDAKFTIDTSDNVGIGTSSPASLTEIQGGLTTTGAVLTLGTKEPTVVVNDVLGRINFYAPLESDGGDSNLVGASIVAVAEDTFSSTVNKTSLFFQTGSSEVATTKMRILSNGNVGINGDPGAYKLSVVGDSYFSGTVTCETYFFVLSANPRMYFYDSGGATDCKIFAIQSASGIVYLSRVTDAWGLKMHSITIDTVGKVGILMTPTYTLDITGNLRCSTGFGCNGTTPQTAYASGGAVVPGAGAFGASSALNFAAFVTLVTNIRLALVANGIMS